MEVKLWNELNDQQAEILIGGGNPSVTGNGVNTGLEASGGSNSGVFTWNNPNNPNPYIWDYAGFGTLYDPGQYAPGQQ